MTVRKTIPDLLPNTNYKIRIRAKIDGIYSDYSLALAFTTANDTTPPVNVTGLTWVVVGDSFHGEWNPVTQNTTGDAISIVRYDVQLVAGATTRVVSVVPVDASSKVIYDLSFLGNLALFTTAQPTVSISVRAVDNHGLTSTYTTPVSATNPVPGPPTLPVVTAGTDSLDISWTPPTDNDLIGYNVYVGATSGFTPSSANRVWSGNATRFSYTSTTYTTQFFKIRAVDKFNQESTDLLTSGTPVSPFVVDSTAPSTPTSLAGTITNNANGIGAKAAVTWVMTSPPSDLAGYNIRFRAVGTTNYQYMSGIDSGALAVQIILDLAYTNYEFQIQAYDFSDNKSAWSATATATSPANAAPANVAGLAATPGKDTIVYTWTPVADTDIKTYEVTFSTSATFASGNITYFTGTATTLTVSGLASGTIYYARVRAVDNGGLTSAAFSSTVSATTGTITPTDGLAPASSPTPSVLSGLSYLYITWAPITNNDPVTYEVHLSTTTGFTPSGATKVTEISGSSAVVDILPGTTTPLSYGTTYFVKLIAKDRDGSAAAGTQGSGTISKVASTDVTSIGADLIVPGTGFVSALVVNTGGSIQSSNYVAATTGWKIAPTGIEMNDAGSTIKVDALKAGTIGGSGGAGVIQVAAGTSINMNGGYIKSNTNAGTTMATAVTSGSGFYLGNDGLFVGGGASGGQIKANALISDTLTSTTITMGAGGSIVGGSWTLNSSGLTIPNGAISAASLNIQTGANLMPPQYADFQANVSYYSASTLTTTAATAIATTAQSKFNTQSLSYSPTNVTNSVFLGATNTDYNIVVQPSTSYIISYYAMVVTGGTAANVTPSLKYATTTTPGTLTGTASSVAANSTWARYSAVVTTPATAVGGSILSLSTNTATGTVFIDGIQIEQQLSNATTPSTWNPPGLTSITGDMIRTGSLISNATTTVNSTTIPYWNINANGSASFANLQVRGNAIVGVAASDDGAASQLSSGNYIAGTAGWSIRSDGVSEFRQMTANSINGESIMAGTLTVDSLRGGTLDDQIALGTGTSLVATGAMGETVGLGDYGFNVTGPQVNTVTNKSSSGTTRTLTTAVPHNFSGPTTDLPLGSKICVNIGDVNYDTVAGTYTYVLNAPTTTTFTYTMPTSVTQTIVAASGTVQGLNPDLRATSPTYIDFPTDGTQPNIISGTLTADTVTVTKNISISTAASITQGATMTIDSVIQPPNSGPSLSQVYNGSKMGSTYGTLVGMTKGGNGNYFVLQGFNSNFRVDEYTVTGSFVATRYSYNVGTTSRSAIGIVWGPGAAAGAGRYYVLYSTFTGNLSIQQVEVFTTAWVSVGVVSIDATGLPGLNIGWDFTNSQLMAAWHPSGALGAQSASIREYTMNASTGVPASIASTITAGYTVWGGSVIGFVGRGDFDYGAGADRIILKDQGYSALTSGQQFAVMSNTGATDTSKNWPVAGSTYCVAAWWDATASKFASVNNSRTTAIYEGGDSYWASASMSDTRWVAYSWYRSISTVSESTCSPATSINLSKRARVQVTIAAIPTGGTTTPDSARVYLLDNSTNTFPTNYFLRSTIVAPAASASIDPYSTSSTTPHLSNDFAAVSGNPGQIMSSTGQSFWKGDDTAQFYQLILQSTSDAATTAGNKPALRVGNITGGHLRIDGNEIIAMQDDTTQAGLYLNIGGSVNLGTGATGNAKIGDSGRLIKELRMGTFSGTVGGTGITTVTHGMSGTPSMVVATAKQVGTARAVIIGNQTSTTFQAEHHILTTGALMTSGSCDFDWIAIMF